MSKKRCIVCGCQDPVNERGACLGCENALKATQQGTSYGKLVGRQHELETRYMDAREKLRKIIEAQDDENMVTGW